MEAIYHRFRSHTLWGSYRAVERSPLEIIEVWQGNGDTVRTVQRSMVPSDLDDWLSEPTHNRSIQQTLRFRLVWVEINVQSQVLNISPTALLRVIDAFGLHAAQGYFRSCVAGIECLSNTKLPHSSATQSEFSMTYAPKIAVLWSNTHCDGSTTGSIAFSRNNIVMFAESRPALEVRTILQGPWNHCIVGLSMFPVVLLALAMGVEIDGNQEEIKTSLREIEVRTGCHVFKNRPEPAALGIPGELSANLSGYVTKLAGMERKCKMVEELVRFARLQVDIIAGTATSSHSPQRTVAAHQSLRECLDLIVGRVRMQRIDNNYTLTRVNVQLNAIANIITQSDAVANHVVARSSYSAAASSRKDSASMKTLAIVAMVFLPGGFVSALFSTPLFDWEAAKYSSSIGVDTVPQFMLYLAITVPLTVATLIVYFYSIWRLDCGTNQILSSPDTSGILIPGSQGEARNLARKRQTVLSV